ncbi:MAG TPA: branched-chain amino acid ABC transporter permease [Reyranella sp.]|nr:branched-chain amino acid ABC transporter permease [Reyranella sp.]
MFNYLLYIATIGGIYALLAMSLNLIWGGAGMVNLGLAGFFALGAYASALLTTAGHLPIPVGWAMALIAGAIGGVVVVFSTTRLREDYLAIVTLGFAEVVRLVASNEIWLTRGTDGISGIPGPWKATLGRTGFNEVYLLILAVVLAAVFLLMRRIDRSPYGRALRAIREDAQVAQVAGKPVLRFKAQAFTLSAAIAGLAGALYGHFTSYIAPDLFLPLITVYIFLSVASGGVGSPTGALVGAYLVMALLESARFIVELIPAVSAVQRAALKELLIALTLILVLRLMPKGVLPERIPRAPRDRGSVASIDHNR